MRTFADPSFALAEAAADAIFVVDRDLRLQYANRALREGLARYGALQNGDSCELRLPPDETSRLRSEVEHVFATSQSLLVERVAAITPAERRWVSIRWVPVASFNGKPCVMGIARGIGAQKRVEDTLRESARRYRTLIDHLPLAVYLKDRHGRYVSVNQRFAYFMQRHPADIVGGTDFDLMSAAQAERVRAEDDRIMLAGEMEEFDHPFFRAGQSLTIRKIKVPVKNDDGQVTGILGMASDVTQQRHLEQLAARHRQFVDGVFDAIPGLLCLVDEAGHPIHWNRQVEALTGYSADEIACRNIVDFYQGDDRERVVEAMKRTLLGERADVEADVTTKSGEKVPLYIVGVPVTLADQRYILGVSFDITERRRTERALHEKDEQLQQEQRHAFARLQSLSRRLLEIQEIERRNLARELHDELGQALTATKITLQTLERYPDPATLAARLADARGIVDHALEQVRSLSLGLRPPLLDDLGLAAALRWLLDQHARRTSMRVQFSEDAAGTRADAAVETACFRIVQETLTNATRHAGASLVSVELRRAGEALHLHVRDDGVGFDVDEARDRAASGASLGLIGMQERATLAGGFIEWMSTPGQGSEVHAWFPSGERR